MPDTNAKPSIWLIAPISLVLLTLVTWVAIWGYPDFNQQLFVLLNRVGAGGAWFWQNLTMLGEGLVAFVLLACFSKKDGRFIWLLLIAAVVAGFSSQLLKHWLDMPRPAVVLDVGSFNLIGAELRSLAFPSGHATTAFVAASMFAWRFPRFALWGYLFFGSVAFSRVAVGAHWPFDVLAGSCLGFLSGKVAIALIDRWFKDLGVYAGLAAWILLVAMAIWLFVFDLDYPDAKLLTVVIGAAGVVTALLNSRKLLLK